MTIRLIFKILVATIAYTTFFAIPSYAGSPYTIRIDSELTEKNLAQHLEILRDTGGRLTINDVMSGELSRSFVHPTNSYPVFAFSKSAYWIRFQVSNELDKIVQWYLEIPNPMLNMVNIYILNSKNDIVKEVECGDNFRFHHREVMHQYFVFMFKEKPRETRTFYLRVQSETMVDMSFFMRSISNYLEKNKIEHFSLGIYFGAILVMIIYNLFVFFNHRDKSYLYYVIYYSFYLMLHLSLSGLAYQYLWPESPWWARNNLPVFFLLCILFSINFARSFLEMPHHLPEFDKLFRLIMLICGVLIPLSFLISHPLVIKICISIMFITIVLIFAVLKKMMDNHFRPARYYLVSMIFLCIGSIIYAVKSFTLLPDIMATTLGHHVASLLEVVTITLGLSDRVNFKKMQSESARKELESIVDKRTEELNLALSNMERRDKDLQKELFLAANIQEGILPQTPYKTKGINIDAYYKGMGKVSGDFYDIFKMSGGYLGILIADVSGHGMPAAFITAMAKISFSKAIHSNLFPSDIFKQVNTELVDVIKTDDFMTASFVVISPTYEVFYGNASHPKPMFLNEKDHSIERWDTGGLFLGALGNVNHMYEDKRAQLNYGDRLLLFTDGIVESKNINLETFGEKRLMDLLRETASLSIEKAKQKIINDWKNFSRGVEQSDDVSFMLIEIDPSYRDLVKFREDGFKLLTMERVKEAIDLLNKALEIDRYDEKSHLFIGECYLKDKNYLKAVEHLNIYLKNNEIDANVLYHLAQAYFNMGNYVMANETALKAAQIRNDSADVLVLSGLSLRDLGHHDEAAKVWERLLTVEPNNELALRELEEIKSRMKKH